eukprot:901499-Rhodomonas_salina.1
MPPYGTTALRRIGRTQPGTRRWRRPSGRRQRREPLERPRHQQLGMQGQQQEQERLVAAR